MNGNILQEAFDLINAERQGEYGAPDASFQRVASMWSAYLGYSVTAHDVACCMALLKLARQANRHALLSTSVRLEDSPNGCRKHDNLLDAAGYIGLAADMTSSGRAQA